MFSATFAGSRGQWRAVFHISSTRGPEVDYAAVAQGVDGFKNRGSDFGRGWMSTQGDSRMEIDYQAPQHVRDIIAGIGRTEDLKFSPSNKLLAVAGYTKNKIAVFYIHIDKLADGTKITLTDAFELYSKQLNEPHGSRFY